VLTRTGLPSRAQDKNAKGGDAAPARRSLRARNPVRKARIQGTTNKGVGEFARPTLPSPSEKHVGLFSPATARLVTSPPLLPRKRRVLGNGEHPVPAPRPPTPRLHSHLLASPVYCSGLTLSH